MNKLQDFPTVYYISLEESKERQKSIEDQFSKYGIVTKSIISKRFIESNDIVTGKYVYSMEPGTIGCAVSHLKAIKDWYYNTDENYAFFCEDDLSLETLEYWNFTWNEFIESIPEDADCVQLLRLKENNREEDFKFRVREQDDWSVTAYIITRDYAKKILDNYCVEDTYHLEIKNSDTMPLAEYLIFNGIGVVYSFPLFVEKQDFDSTFRNSSNHNYELHQSTHLKSYNEIVEWWKTIGKNKSADDIISNKEIKETEIFNKSDKKIVDYTTFYGPTCKEMLELRINVLNDYVDEFIICESNKSQSGIPIEYELEKTIDELNLPKNKIRVIKLNIPEDDELEILEIDKHNCYDGNDSNLNSLRARVRERMQKDALLSVIGDYDDDTVFIHSDIDEIIKPNCVEYISNIVRNSLHVVIRIPLVHLEGRADLRVYIKDTDKPKEWTGMFLATKQHLKNATPTQIRSNVFNPYPINFITENNVRCEDLGWHFSWMGGSEYSKIKSKSFTHYDDTFSYLASSKYSAEDNEEFLENLSLKPGDISPSGDKNTVLKYYETDELPVEVFRIPRVREFLLPEIRTHQITKEQLELEVLLNEYSVDTENAERNFNLGVWYDKQGHTAPALSYFLRAAERTDDKLLAYEALIWGSFCYEKQGTRDGTAKSLLQQALALLPKRPEAYYLLSKFNEKRHWWQDAYLYSTQALDLCEFENLEPLRSDFGYPGKYGIIYEKAVSAWWWDRANEARELIADLKNNYKLNSEFIKLVNEYVDVTKSHDLIQKKIGDSIPVIGVPIVNGFHWLERLIESIDYPVKDVVIINNNGRGELTDQLNELCHKKYEHIESVKIVHMPSNIGVSASWNLIIKSYINSPYWIIANNDVAFTPGCLEEMLELAKDDKVGMVGEGSLFLIKDTTIQKCGLFDENFYPAYLEDFDYSMRLMNNNIKKVSIKTQFYHGETLDYSQSGSQTWRQDLSLKDKLDFSRESNEYYMKEKWGDDWVGPEWSYYNPHKYPFNNENLPISYTTYDLKFVRRKHLGF